MATSTYTPRAFASGASLAALAAVPAAAGPFPTLAEVNASPDHELLVLGAQLRRAHAEARAQAMPTAPLRSRCWIGPGS